MKKRIINLVIFIISIFLITGCNNKSNKLKSIDDYVNDDNISFVYNALDTVVLTGKCTVLRGNIEKGTISDNDSITIVLNDGTEINASIKEVITREFENATTTVLCLNDVEASSVRDLWYVAYKNK